jgi:hypothetical protein
VSGEYGKMPRKRGSNKRIFLMISSGTSGRREEIGACENNSEGDTSQDIMTGTDISRIAVSIVSINIAIIYATSQYFI